MALRCSKMVWTHQLKQLALEIPLHVSHSVFSCFEESTSQASKKRKIAQWSFMREHISNFLKNMILGLVLLAKQFWLCFLRSYFNCKKYLPPPSLFSPSGKTCVEFCLEGR